MRAKTKWLRFFQSLRLSESSPCPIEEIGLCDVGTQNVTNRQEIREGVQEGQRTSVGVGAQKGKLCKQRFSIIELKANFLQNN